MELAQDWVLDPDKVPIVVVEDDPADAHTIERILVTSVYQPLLVHSVRDALQIIQAVTPAAIIIDVVLTGDESWRLILQLRKQDASANIPLIVSSSTGDDRKAVHLGADEYIPKPVNGEVLIDALDRLTGRRSLTKVLLVDDEEVTHYLVRQLLPRGRFGLSIANNGRDGFERLLELKPDVVLLDLRMPGMDGYTFLDRMSASPTLAEVPAIVMTSTVLSAADHARLGRASLVMSKSDLSTSALIEAITRVQSAPEPIGAA
jgi:CheY-like chemotaxis protein